MRLMDKQRKTIDTRRPNYAVFRRRRRVALLIFLLLATLILGSLGLYLLSGTTEETVDETAEQVETPPAEEEPRETATEEEPVGEEPVEEEARAPAVPEDPTLYLTVPKLGLYGHTVRNDDSEVALDMGAVKLPDTGFPWEQKDTNTYIACHRLGWPGNESYNQCLNLPLMQQGDQIFLEDSLGRAYEYRVTEALQITPQDTWIKRPSEGKDVVSLQTCIETLGNIWTMGPNWTARYVIQAEKVT
ncbi:MAG TPA: class E sortase [Rubrobacteraceae bacterium]|nr:class E sortase [Rubrobacteraceae bacterium]